MYETSITITTEDSEELEFVLLDALNMHSVELSAWKAAVAHSPGKVTNIGVAASKDYVVRITYFCGQDVVQKDFIYDHLEDAMGVIDYIRAQHATALECEQGRGHSSPLE